MFLFLGEGGDINFLWARESFSDAFLSSSMLGGSSHTGFIIVLEEECGYY